MGTMREWIEESMPQDVTEEQLRAGFVRAVATLARCRVGYDDSDVSACPKGFSGFGREPCAGCFVHAILEAEEEPMDLACCWVAVLLGREPSVAAALRVWNIDEQVPGKCRSESCETGGPLHATLNYRTGESDGCCICSACGREWELDEVQDGGETDGQ